MPITKGWSSALKNLEKWMESDLVNAMVYGGLGLQGIADTSFYRFISSPDGLSQLGIESSEPPKLLSAYKRTIKVLRSSNFIEIRFGDLALLKLATPHPASGTGNLHIQSWLEWITDDIQIDRGFVPRERLPGRAQKNIRIQSAPGGLMLHRGQFGNSGLWRFPVQLANFEQDWIRTNIGKIEQLLQKQIIFYLSKSIK